MHVTSSLRMNISFYSKGICNQSDIKLTNIKLTRLTTHLQTNSKDYILPHI